jgi:hypothetical protein
MSKLYNKSAAKDKPASKKGYKHSAKFEEEAAYFKAQRDKRAKEAAKKKIGFN